jgi:hypothetical protein
MGSYPRAFADGFCLSKASGKFEWKANIARAGQAKKPRYFRFQRAYIAPSPL